MANTSRDVVGAPAVSVVIPTCDRPASLAVCLHALRHQTLGRKIEVIVVDDGSPHGSAEGVVSAVFPEALLLRHGRRGPASARNAGAALARAPVVCFTDDDTEPSPDWAAQLLAAIEQGADAVGGRTLVSPSAGRFAIASQAIADHLCEYTLGGRRGAPFTTANNLACRPQVLAEVPFDPSYRTAGGEDRDWCARLANAGFSLVAVADAELLHCQVLDLRRFLGQHVRYGRGAYRYRRAHRSAGWLARPGFYAQLLRRAFRQGLVVGGLVSVAQIATAVGVALEMLETKLK